MGIINKSAYSFSHRGHISLWNSDSSIMCGRFSHEISSYEFFYILLFTFPWQSLTAYLLSDLSIDLLQYSASIVMFI